MARELTDEDIDDEISVTSTIEENSDSENEWPVNKVLAEGESDGEVKYLIEWQGFPLADATWEPRSNLKDALMADWEQTKANQENGLVSKFRIREWREAAIRQFQFKLSRHERRNRKRARLGLPQTTWEITLQDVINEFDSLPKDEDEQDIILDHEPPLNETNAGKAHSDGTKDHVRSRYSPRSMNGPEIVSREKFGFRLTRDVTRSESVGSMSISDLNVPLMPPLVSSKSQPIDKAFELRIGSNDPRTNRRSLPQGISRTSQPVVGGLTRQLTSMQTASTVATNVFAGGRLRRGKMTLRDAALNPETQPKFLNSRLQRRLELQQRNKEGVVAPIGKPTALFSLDLNDPDTASRGDFARVHERSGEADPNLGINTLKQKRRSVHWDDEQMDLDPEDSLFVPEKPSTLTDNQFEEAELALISEPAKISEPSRRTSTRTRISLGDYRSNSTCELISKTSQFGHGDVQSIEILFNGIFPNRKLPWFKRFASFNHLIFAHTCTAQDFTSQTRKDGISVIKKLSEGLVSSNKNKEALRNLAARLWHDSLGALCIHEDYCLLVIPTNCDDWDSTRPNEDATLQYLIFESKGIVDTSMLAPTPSKIVSDKQNTHPAHYSRSFEQLFGQRYHQLLPSSVIYSAGKHHFFLAFPSRAGQESAMLSRWLRNSRGDCDITTSHFLGHWDRFLKFTHGAVIIHEDALQAIRLFPGISDALNKYSPNFKFWLFTRSLLPLSLLEFKNATVPTIGDIQLQRIFPHGLAILVTPSFLISQPEQAYSLLKWFWGHYYMNSDIQRAGTLVVCARIDDWLYDLAMEKTAYEKAYLEAYMNNRLKQGDSLEARLKTWKVLRQLTADSMNERSNSLIFAPEAIDGNDEQSLVNWYGYWSVMNVDQFRSFIVLGSSWQDSKRLSRTIRIPNYDKSVSSDPDEQNHLLDHPSLSGTACVNPIHEFWLNREDEASAMSYRLVEMAKSLQSYSWCPVTLYWFPIAYWHVDMPFHLRDIKSKFKTYAHWFKFFWQDFSFFAKKTQKSFRNTYAGLFYTLDRKWDPSLQIKHPRYLPWIAVFRPINPHLRPWKGSELFIWDIGHLENINKGTEFHYGTLPEGQQQLIEFLREETKGSLPLEKVWVGAFGSTENGDVSASDITLRWLEAALGKVRDWLPAPAKEIPVRGWVLVAPQKPGEHQRDTRTRADLDEVDVNPPAVANAQVPRTIFHPPRRERYQGATKSKNRLYQCAMEASGLFRGKAFEYTFRPTVDWYREQCEEGRGYEHVRVTTWEALSEHLRIDTPRQA